ncbi:General stress protein 69 [compost metagenome]
MKLGLGTAQLGMLYGVANQTGQPTIEEALKILDRAISKGVTLFDTAPGYGESEKIIGQYLNNVTPWYKNTRPFEIVTKIPKIDETQTYNSLEIDRILEESLYQSIDNLSVNAIDCCLLHSPVNMISHQHKVIHSLKKLKDKGLTKKIGVSVYSPEDIIQFLGIDGVDIIQVPINIFDLRLINSGLLKDLKQHGVEIHARSVYLQGLILMSLEQLPTYLNEARTYLSELKELSITSGITCAQLALLFVRDLLEIDKMIIGCESINQLDENIDLMGYPKLDELVKSEILRAFSVVPEYIVNPSKWRR